MYVRQIDGLTGEPVGRSRLIATEDFTGIPAFQHIAIAPDASLVTFTKRTPDCVRYKIVLQRLDATGSPVGYAETIVPCDPVFFKISIDIMQLR